MPLCNRNSPPSLTVAVFFIETESKMKLWDVLATCLLLLSSVAARPLYHNAHPAKRTYFPGSYSDTASLSVEDEEPSFQRDDHNLQEISMEERCKARGMSHHTGGAPQHRCPACEITPFVHSCRVFFQLSLLQSGHFFKGDLLTAQTNYTET